MSPGDPLRLPDGEDHHLKNVLRARPGDVFEVVSKGGDVFLAEVREGGEAVVVEEVPSGGESFEVVLYQAVPKGKRMDLVVEKATEVGVTGVVPLVTERSVVKPGEGNKVDRWRRLAESAARQSLREAVPEVSSPVAFREAVERAGEGVLLHNDAALPPLEEVVGAGAANLFVGPEGGWSEAEVRFAEEAGVVPAQVGPFRLRSETAGIIAVARARAALEVRNVKEKG